MRMKDLIVTLLSIALLTLLALGLFPPWATLMSGNGYPRIAFRWIGSPPQPVGGSIYQVDIVRLQRRITLLSLPPVVLAIGIVFNRKLR